MSNLARQEMYFQRFSLPWMSWWSSIEAVTAESIQQMANASFDTRQIALTVLGNLEGLKISRERLDCN